MGKPVNLIACVTFGACRKLHTERILLTVLTTVPPCENERFRAADIVLFVVI